MPTHFNLLGNNASFLPQRSSLLDSYRSNLMERRKDAPDTLDLLKNTGQWMKENPLDALAIGTAPIPVAGDVIGVANDLRHLAQNPSWGNLGWTALGALPFVPSGIGAFRRHRDIGGARKTYYHGTPDEFTKFEDPSLNPAGRGAIYVTENKDIAKAFAEGLPHITGELPFKSARILPVKIKGNIFDYDNPQHMAKAERAINKTDKWNAAEKKKLIKGLEAGEHESFEAVGTELRKAGFDGYRTVEDIFGGSVSEGIGMFDPKNVKILHDEIELLAAADYSKDAVAKR